MQPHETEQRVETTDAAGARELCALAAAARAGDREAWAKIYERLGPLVHGVLLVRVGRSDAEDLTQEVFAKALARIGELREDGAIAGWLAQMARNEAAGWRRGRWRFGAAMLRLAGMGTREEKTRAGEPRWTGDEVLAAIRSLPEAYQEPLVLRLVSGLGGVQIAEALGMTHGSVRVNLTKGMRLLKGKLGLEDKP